MTLRDALNRHYAGQRLDDAALARLRESANAKPPRRMGHLVAAALVLGAIAWLLWPDADRSAPVFEEIALNHRKSFLLECTTDRFESLRAGMPKLDFAPARPGGWTDAGLLGARYCSLQGSVAAQIRVRRDDGAILTLYQTRDGARFRDLKEGDRVVDGVRVRIWREAGLVMGLAETTR
ncbi:MAG: hypothetical protein OER88_05100 [Planctomycetota bacterium]|nr:hypothetical protein [Planctomycetota bacterium]